MRPQVQTTFSDFGPMVPGLCRANKTQMKNNESSLRILVSAYACDPGIGSEPGAGWSLLRAASRIGECWVVTRENNVASVRRAISEQPTENEVHIIGIDLRPWALRLKRWLGPVGMRPYYFFWQRLARIEAAKLHRRVAFDLVHHATFSSFWLPMGVNGIGLPTVLGPLSGGERTPPGLLRYLGLRGMVSDGIRSAVTWSVAAVLKRRLRKLPFVLISQSSEMARFARRFVGPFSTHVTFSHALEPPLVPVRKAERDRTVLFAGRLLPWKGVALAIDAFAVANADASFVIVGEGPDRGRLERRVNRRGLSDKVVFVGNLDRAALLERMMTARVLLFPSFHDSAGFVVSEALTLGLPVVCLDHAGPGELVHQWPQAPYVAVSTTPRIHVVDSLAVAIRRFVNEPAPHPEKPNRANVSLVAHLKHAYAAALDTKDR